MTAQRLQSFHGVECAVAWIEPMLRRVINVQKDGMKSSSWGLRVKSKLRMGREGEEIALDVPCPRVG